MAAGVGLGRRRFGKAAHLRDRRHPPATLCRRRQSSEKNGPMKMVMREVEPGWLYLALFHRRKVSLLHTFARTSASAAQGRRGRRTPVSRVYWAAKSPGKVVGELRQAQLQPLRLIAGIGCQQAWRAGLQPCQTQFRLSRPDLTAPLASCGLEKPVAPGCDLPGRRAALFAARKSGASGSRPNRCRIFRAEEVFGLLGDEQVEVLAGPGKLQRQGRLANPPPPDDHRQSGRVSGLLLHFAQFRQFQVAPARPGPRAHGLSSASAGRR